jgi:hypothetical protein
MADSETEPNAACSPCPHSHTTQRSGTGCAIKRRGDGASASHQRDAGADVRAYGCRQRLVQLQIRHGAVVLLAPIRAARFGLCSHA